jgi:Tfp pilus assembly protein PilF
MWHKNASMLRTIFVCSLFFIALPAFSQKERVTQLVKEGVELHDKGDYEGAITKYDEALKIDQYDFNANYEKSLSSLYAKHYKECIEICRFMIVRFADDPLAKQVYSNYGSALDDSGETDEAIRIYNEGIGKFPGYYSLFFNRGLTYLRLKKNEEALKDFTSSIRLNPLHPASNLYTGLILKDGNRIPAYLALITFIIAEPQGDRAKRAFGALEDIRNKNITKNGNNTTITLSSDALDTKNKKKTDDDFSSIELMFSLMSSMDTKEADSVIKTAADKFDLQLQIVINSLEVNKKNAKGFYWQHYVPFFTEMKKKEFTSVVSNIIYMSSEADSSLPWIKDNNEKVKAFYKWVGEYKWE